MAKQDDFLKSFLGDDAEEQGIALPSGEGLTTGFIGPLTAAVRYQFWSEDELDLEDWVKGGDDRKGFKTRGREGSHFYYFEDNDEAKEAAAFLGAYKPNQVWRFEMASGEVLNAATNLEESWGETIGGDVRITTLRSKYRHEFHMMSLPSALNALAMRMGILEESGFSLDDLVGNEIWTDALEQYLVGSKGATEQDAAAIEAAVNLCKEAGDPKPLETVRQYILNDHAHGDIARVCAYCGTYHTEEVNRCTQCGAGLELKGAILEACQGIDFGTIHYRYSELWKRRAALWFGLGENNAEAFHPSGTGTKWDTESKTLNQLLGIVTRPWVAPIWARLVLVPNPRVDATFGDENKRLSVPCLVEIFEDEAAARKAAEEEGIVTTDAGGEEDDSGLPLPEQWVGYRDEWIAELTEVKGEHGDKRLTPPKLKAYAEKLSCTPDEVKAWWDEV